MKNLTITMLIMLIAGFVTAEQGDQVSKREFNELHNTFSDSIRSMNEKIVELNRLLKIHEVSKLENLNDASNTIDYLNKLVGSFGVIFTILTCIIAIITIGLPILTYQLGIKPSQRALRDLETNMDNRIDSYLKNNRDKQIEQAFSNLTSESTALKSQGINFLTLTHHQGFSDTQMFKIYSLLKRNLNEISMKSQLSFLLATSKNEYADELFNDKEYLGDQTIKQMALFYFVKTGLENNIGGFKKIIQLSSDKHMEYMSILYNTATNSTGDIIKVLESQELIDELGSDALKKLKDYKQYLSFINISEVKFKETKLYKATNACA